MRRERCRWTLLLLLLLVGACKAVQSDDCSRGNVSHPRVNRAINAGYKYLIFPQGSNVQLIYCLTLGSFARPHGFFTLGVTAGLAYELPSRRTLPYRKPAEVYHRRNRRDLYRKLEAMLESQGKHGRNCVLQALCRVGQLNRQQRDAKASFLQEILQSVFTFPDLQLRQEDQHDDELHYQRAYNAQEHCDQLFQAHSCPWIF